MPEPDFEKAVLQSVEAHMERRATTKVEVQRLGWFRWRYRFYWGRYVVQGPTRRWFDYESGVRITRQGALFAAARKLTKLQVKDTRKWETSSQGPKVP
jgi:hypothetical protein